jgi:hypothetical protein
MTSPLLISDKRSYILRGLYEMQAQCLHSLQSVDMPDKKECYKKIIQLDPLSIVKDMLRYEDSTS